MEEVALEHSFMRVKRKGFSSHPGTPDLWGGVGNPQLTHCFFYKGNKEWIVEKKMVAIWGTDFWSPPSEFWLAGLKFPASKSRINTLRNTPSRLHCSASDNTNAPHSATMEEPQASHVHYAPENSPMPRHPTKGWKMAAKGNLDSTMERGSAEVSKTAFHTVSVGLC